MRYSSFVVAAAAFTGFASAQNYSTSGPLSIVPSSVDSPTRQAWCRSQLTICPMLCGGQANPNTCDSNSLNYTCTCTGSSNQPNISDYMGTIPFFVCQQWVGDCTAAHPNDLAGQTTCQSVKCGAKNASEAATSSSSSSSAASSSATGSATSSSSGSSSTGGAAAGSSSTGSSTASSASATSSKSAAMAISMAKEYSAGVLLAGAVAVFGFAL